jgi:hypothetical protein
MPRAKARPPAGLGHSRLSSLSQNRLGMVANVRSRNAQFLGTDE